VWLLCRIEPLILVPVGCAEDQRPALFESRRRRDEFAGRPKAQPYWHLDLVASLHKSHTPALTGLQSEHCPGKPYSCVTWSGLPS